MRAIALQSEFSETPLSPSSGQKERNKWPVTAVTQSAPYTSCVLSGVATLACRSPPFARRPERLSAPFRRGLFVYNAGAATARRERDYHKHATADLR